MFSAEFVQERFGVFQVRRVKAFGEQAGDHQEDLASFGLLILLVNTQRLTHSDPCIGDSAVCPTLPLSHTRLRYRRPLIGEVPMPETS